MWRVADTERRVLQLEAPDADADAETRESPAGYLLPPSRASILSNAPHAPGPLVEQQPADVVLHCKKCAFPLHLSALQRRCPFLHKQLRQLRHPRSESPRQRPRELQAARSEPGGFALRLLDAEELTTMRTFNSTRDDQPEPEDAEQCPVTRARQRARLDHVQCVGHASREQSPVVQRRKRLRQDPAALGDEKQTQVAAETQRRRARRLFSEEASWDRKQQQPGVLHVEIVGAVVPAVVTLVEYLYTYKVRIMDEARALEAVKLAQWLHMRDSMRYYCLTIAIRHVTTATWMEMLMAAAAVTDSVMRRVLCDDLITFLHTLQPEQYYQVLTDVRTVCLSLVNDHDMLVRVVVGLINNVRLVEFWRNVLNGLSRWLFQTSEPRSLRWMHKQFAPDWKPYMEQAPVEVKAKPGEAGLFTLLRFGKFQLQVRIDILEEMPIMWRIIRSSSLKLLTSDPDIIDGPEALANDPEFWIRGHMKIKYWRADSGDTEVSEVVMIEYQHCYQQYSQWSWLVPAKPSTLAPLATTPAVPPEGMGRAQFRGKFFVWGDPICSLYHFLLQTTLFYAAPHSASPEMSDLMIVSEMQRLPVETLVLVLRSDRLRVPYGEQTLLRCLNKMVFGDSFSHLQTFSQSAHSFNGRAKDVIRLYKCVRWCFVPLDDIINSLRLSPRELKFYELILKGLQDTFKRFHRRRPWGWRKYRHAYMKNETNAIEFMIEAGENHLSPDNFPRVFDKLSQDSVSSPTAAWNSSSHPLSLPSQKLPRDR